MVDCDLRRPRVHITFGIDAKTGITEFISGEKTIQDIILKDVEKNLDILPSKYSKQNLTTIFLSNKIKNLMLEFKKKYDLIILDTPPLIVSTDAILLSKYADGIIYICGYNMVSKNELIQSKKLLDRVNARIYGVVMNKIDKNGYYHSKYY